MCGARVVRFILGESINLIRDEVDLVSLTKGKQILDGLWRLLVCWTQSRRRQVATHIALPQWVVRARI